MFAQIQEGHIFTTQEWPGGYNDLPIITFPEKKINVVHMKHIVQRRKQVSGSLGVKKSASKSRGPRVRPFDVNNIADDVDLKVWVGSQLESIRKEYAEKVMKLEARTKKIRKAS